jgi:DNA gyrase/topoisomerase IV subunit B
VFGVDTGPGGLHALLFGLVDNSIREALAGHGEEIEVTLHADGSASVADHGRGIHVGPHPHFDGLDRFEVLLTK